MTTKSPSSILLVGCLLLYGVSMQGCATKAGECDPPCSSPLTCCDGFCVNLMSDDDNCGECGNACEEGSHCTMGVCPDVCGTEVCSVSQTCCNDECVDTTVDPDHCGECDNACDSGWECLDSVCEQTECDPPCEDGETCCSIPGGEPVCADLENDREHCGVCRNECDAVETCSEGICTETPCEPPCGGDPYACCGGTCYNLDTDMDNCGYCGNACDPDKADECRDGTCMCNGYSECNIGQQCCPGVGCRSIMADPDNCGECGNVCEEGLTCTDGECLCGGAECVEGETCCMNSCRDLQTDPSHCGECGHSCGVNAPTCVDGGCKCGDDPPCSTLCGYWACDSYTPPGPYDDCQVCCPSLGGCVPMSDTSCGDCTTECEGDSICVPVLYGLPPPFGGYCAFECRIPGVDGTVDVIFDTTGDTSEADVPDADVPDAG